MPGKPVPAAQQDDLPPTYEEAIKVGFYNSKGSFHEKFYNTHLLFYNYKMRMVLVYFRGGES